MRVLLTRVSVLSVCVLAVSAAPARGQSSETPAPLASAGTNIFVAKFINSTDLGSSAMYEVFGKVGVGTTNPFGSMHVRFSDSGGGVTGYAVQNLSSAATAYPGMRFYDQNGTLGQFQGLDNATHEYRINNFVALNSATTSAAATDTAVGAGAPQSSTSEDRKIKIFGKAKLDVIWNEARPQAPGAPFFLVPTFVGGFTNHTLDINARQSLLGVLFTGPKIGNFQSGGRISAVFFDPSVLADKYGFLLQASYGELFNDRWRFAAGLQFDVFAPGLPTVLPFSYLGGSGSPGNCIRGQIRVERFVDVGSDSQLTLQGALSQPLNTAVTPDIILDEDNGWPNVEGRIAFGLGKPAPIGLLTQRPVEVAVSGVVGQLRRTAPPTEPPRRVVSDVWGAAVDFRVNLAGRFGFQGEVYTGQALGNYNGAILQSLDAVTWEPISGTGGFVEGFVYLTPKLHSHAGIGIDEADDDDITAIPNTLFGRTYNSTVYGNLLWDLDKTFRIAFEATYRKTEYKDPTSTGRLPNEGFGFHTQFQWTF